MPARKDVSVSFVRSLVLFAIALATVITPLVAPAQSYLNATGSPTFTAALPVEMGFVNVANGNLHLEIPLTSFPQRGSLHYNGRLVYDSSIWKVSAGAWQATNVPNSMGGWRLLTGGETGTVTFTNGSKACDTPPPVQFRSFHTAFVWTAPDGTTHRFPIFTMQDRTICQEGVSSDTEFADDSSGYMMSVTNYTSATVYAPDGTQVFPTVMDSNGNFFSKDGGGNIIDTLGRTPVAVQSAPAPPPNTIIYDILSTTPGQPTKVTVTTTTVSANTTFGQIGVTECTTCSFTAIQSIAFDDGSSYTFTYDSGTTAGHFGQLASMKLRTGGTVSYGYTTFADGSGAHTRWLSSKSTDSGTWSYTPLSQGQTAQQVTVKDCLNNSIVYSFTLNNGAWVSSASYKDPNQVNMGTVTNSWDMSNSCPQNSGCSGAAFVRRLSVTTQMPGGLTKQATYNYLSATTGQVSEIDESDFGTGTLPILRKKLFSYAPLTNAVSKPSQILVEDGSGNQVSKTNLTYDEGQPAPTSGVPQHNAVSGSRGNLTTLTQWVSPTSSLPTKFTYDDTGNMLSRIDPLNNVTSLSYTDNFSDGINRNTLAYVTQITLPSTGSPAVAHILKMQYEPNTGFSTKTTDLNNHDTTASYDPATRTLTTNFPDGGQTVTTLSSATTTTQSRLITPTQTLASATVLDALGRVSQQQITSDPSGTDTVDTTYNPNGQVASVSNPHRSGASPTDGTTQLTYDALGRVTVQTTQPDANAVQTSYSDNCVTTTDQVGNQREACSDGLGRITKVLEPDSSGNLTIETDTTYDVLNNPLQITQKGGSVTPSDWRVRTFTYDGLGRLTQMTAPESGTTTYSYTTASGALCAGDPNSPCRITDARNITKTLAYDALNRLTGKTYSDPTPPVTYFYDQSSFQGLAIANGNGLRTGMSDGFGATAWSFDAMGRVKTRQQTIGAVTKSIGFTYNLDGSTATMTYPSGRVYTYGYNNAAQPTSVVDVANNINFFTNGAYAPPGLLTGGNHGAKTGWTGITLVNTFNSRLEPTELKATSPLPLTLLDLAYSYDQGGGKNNGSVAQIANLRDSTRTANYTYDLLNRLSSAATTAATWGDSYGYDNWGNLLQKTVTKGTAENLPPLTIDSHNQIKNAGFTYDLAGNLLSDGTNSMTYDAENRRNPTSGTTFTYDGDGRRVAKSDGTVYWVDDSFRPLSLGTNTGSITKDFVFLGSKRIAFVALSSGNPYYYLSDHLGSTAVIGSGDGKAIEWEADYFPFGNQRQVFTNLVSNSYQFTGYEYDSSSGYNYAVARFESGKWSRFLSPDPYLGSMDIRNPQSLNRYSYVMNNPLALVDPLGLDCAFLDDSGEKIDEVDSDSDTSPSECTDNGGYYIPGTLTGFTTGDDGTITGFTFNPFGSGNDGTVEGSCDLSSCGQAEPAGVSGNSQCPPYPVPCDATVTVPYKQVDNFSPGTGQIIYCVAGGDPANYQGQDAMHVPDENPSRAAVFGISKSKDSPEVINEPNLAKANAAGGGAALVGNASNCLAAH